MKYVVYNENIASATDILEDECPGDCVGGHQDDDADLSEHEGEEELGRTSQPLHQAASL